MFSSYRQLRLEKPTRFCDLLALVHIAYYFVNGSVPCTEHARALLKARPNIFSLEEFTAFRTTHKRLFD